MIVRVTVDVVCLRRPPNPRSRGTSNHHYGGDARFRTTSSHPLNIFGLKASPVTAQRSTFNVNGHLPTHLSMTSTFLTPDLILRAVQEPNPTQDFPVHKSYLSRSFGSPILNHELALAQPPDQTHTALPSLPVVYLPYPPEVVDAFLQFIYPRDEPLKFADLPTLEGLLSMIDRYKIGPMKLDLKRPLKLFIPDDPFAVYMVARRYGLLEEAVEAAMVSTPRTPTNWDNGEEAQPGSGLATYRFIGCVRWREETRRAIIKDIRSWSPQNHADDDHRNDAKHQSDAVGFYTRMAEMIEERFIDNPRVELPDILRLTFGILDDFKACKRASGAAKGIRGFLINDEVHPLCPLHPTRILNSLTDLTRVLEDINREMLGMIFGEAPEVAKRAAPYPIIRIVLC